MLSAKAVDRWAENWGEGLNPILVKETRQIFKTRLVTIPFLGALLFAWFVSISIVMQPVHPQSVLGPEILAQLMVVLGIALFYVVPYISFRSMAAERDRHTFEMLAVSALSDTQIFWGKFFSAIILIGLFEAAFAPFISMTYMLRGLSVLDIAAALIVISAVALTLSLFGLMLGALATQLHWQIVNMLLLLGGSTFAAAILAQFVAFTMFTSGGDRAIWNGLFSNYIRRVAGSVFCSRDVEQPAAADDGVGADLCWARSPAGDCAWRRGRPCCHDRACMFRYGASRSPTRAKKCRSRAKRYDPCCLSSLGWNGC